LKKKRFKDSVKIVHFIGAQKPWYYTYNADTRAITGNVQLTECEHLVQWWCTFYQQVYPRLPEELVIIKRLVELAQI
jgi:lipopolysaccharide biosynthesis glycosyltransferase